MRKIILCFLLALPHSLFAQRIFQPASSYDGVACAAADLNGDRQIDVADFNILLGYVSHRSPLGDINRDKATNSSDIFVLVPCIGTVLPVAQPADSRAISPTSSPSPWRTSRSSSPVSSDILILSQNRQSPYRQLLRYTEQVSGNIEQLFKQRGRPQRYQKRSQSIQVTSDREWCT